MYQKQLLIDFSQRRKSLVMCCGNQLSAAERVPNIPGMQDLASVGERIALARKRAMLRQLDLAERAGVSRATIDALENGRASEIGYSRLARILRAVGLELRVQRSSPAARNASRRKLERKAQGRS